MARSVDDEKQDQQRDQQPSMATLLKRTAVVTLASGVAHGCTLLLCGRLLPEKRWRRLSQDDQLSFAKVILSSLQGTCVGLSSLYLVKQGVYAKDVLRPYPKVLDTTFTVTAGWAMWDLVLMAVRGSPMSMWLHHLVTASGCILMMWYRVGSFFPAMFQVTSLTIAPANLHWILSKLRLRHTAWFRLNIVLRVLTHTLFRTFVGILTVLHALRVHGVKFFPKFAALPLPVVLGSTFNVLSLSYLNLMWARDAWRDLFRHVLSASAPSLRQPRRRMV